MLITPDVLLFAPATVQLQVLHRHHWHDHSLNGDSRRRRRRICSTLPYGSLSTERMGAWGLRTSYAVSVECGRRSSC